MFFCEAVTQQRRLYICLFRGRYPATGLHATILNNNKFGNQEHADEHKSKSRNVLCRHTNYEHTDTAPHRQDSVVHPPLCWSLRLAPRRLAGHGGFFQWLCYHQHSTHPHCGIKPSLPLKKKSFITTLQNVNFKISSFQD
jgi:hypothetical protein